MTMLKKTFSRIDRGLAFIEDWTLFLTVAVALVSAMANVVLRKLTSDVNLYWSDEVVRKAIFISTYIGCVAAIRHRSLIRIDALPQLVPILKKPLNVISHLVVLVFSGTVCWLGLQLTKMMYADAYAKTATLGIAEWYFYAILPLMGAMMMIRTILVMIEDLRDGGTPS
jgi:C4-dicarboxylate transporter, DctQ subunit